MKEADKIYHMVMLHASNLLKDGIITSIEYDKFNEQMIKKYAPLFED